MSAEAPSPGFEGVEKVLEIDFAPGLGEANGLRDIPRADWDAVLTDAKCTILARLSSGDVDSYVLSESSLFVYPRKLVLKTCGTTTLLMCLPRLLELTQRLSLRVEWVAYTRKDFQFPAAQKYPHRGPKEEITYLKELFPEGSAFLMGPVTGDHWLVFVADYVDRATTECVDRTLDMMMFGIDEEVAKLFVKDKARFPNDSDVSTASGISSLLPGSLIQEFCFEPCGYSMNGLHGGDAYWTIHITPESHCSYASFETNMRVHNYGALVKAVLAIFRPRRYTMTLFADEEGLKQLRGPATFPILWNVPFSGAGGGGSGDGSARDAAAGGAEGGGGGSGEAAAAAAAAAGGAAATSGGGSGWVANYVQTHKSQSEFMGYSCIMANYRHVATVAAGASEDEVARAATETLSMPRARYIIPQSLLAQRVASMQERIRKESF